MNKNLTEYKIGTRRWYVDKDGKWQGMSTVYDERNGGITDVMTFKDDRFNGLCVSDYGVMYYYYNDIKIISIFVKKTKNEKVISYYQEQVK